MSTTQPTKNTIKTVWHTFISSSSMALVSESNCVNDFLFSDKSFSNAR